MKKEYVKPMIESEEFVANEYVAACWTMTCTNSDGSCGSEFYKADTYNIDNLNIFSTENGNHIGTYTGSINQKEGCRTDSVPKDYNITNLWTFLQALLDWLFNNNTTTVYFHPVLVSEGYDNYTDGKDHPNASV